MSLSLAIAASLLAQTPLPKPAPGAPPPYFTQLENFAGRASTPGFVDGVAHTVARLESPLWMTSDPQGSWVLTVGPTQGTSVIRFINGGSVYSWSLVIPISAGEISGLAVNTYSRELYFTHRREHLIYKIDFYGQAAQLFAGSSDLTTCENQFPPECFVGGYHDDQGQAALFTGPTGIALDSAGNVYVSDTGNHTIRKLTPGAVSSSLFPPLAGFNPAAMVMDEVRGRLLVLSNGAVYSVTFAGQITLIAGIPGTYTNWMQDGDVSVARFAYPRGLAVDGSGNIFVTDTEAIKVGLSWTYRGAIRQISPGMTFPRMPYLDYPTSVTTLALTPALVPPGVISDGVLTQPAGLTWVGNSLAVTDVARHTVRLIR